LVDCLFVQQQHDICCWSGSTNSSILFSLFYDTLRTQIPTELLMALKFLHDRFIMYRDLKPENILIASDGHVKLCDFGFATKLNGVDGRAMSKVGTPHYLAPEILDMHSQEGYTFAIDIWSWACVLYEMIRGRPAFGTAMDTSYAVYIRVMKAKYKMPTTWKASVKNIIRNLLECNIDKRLTNIDEITSHVIFEKVDWDAAGTKRLRPPYVPRLRELDRDGNDGGVDHSHFDKWKIPDYRKATSEENGQFRDF
jgi:serine/threonine protein kinase